MAELKFNGKTHSYTLCGEEIPSVTQVIRFCFADTDKSRPWLAQQAADRGRRVHEYCLLMDYGALPETVDTDCAGYIRAYIRFLDDYSPQWQLIEFSDWAETGTLPVAGTIDRAGSIDGAQCVLDIKTGAIHEAAVAAQLYAYRLIALRKLKSIEMLYVLKLSRDGTYELRNMDQAMGKQVFTACMTLHGALKKTKEDKARR